MADMTPKIQQNFAAKKKSLTSVMDAINKKSGKLSIGFASEPEIMDKLTIKYIEFPSLRLNAMTGGGLPIGKVSIISGLEDSGKTSLLLETIGKQMAKDPNFVAFWLETENSLELKYLRDTFKIDLDRFVYKELESKGAGETALDILEVVVKTGSVNMVVINSLKCLTPSKEFEDSMKDNNVGLQARFNAKFMRKIVAHIAEHEVALVMTQHRTTNIGQMYGDNMVLSGGNAIRFASILTLDLRKKSIQDSDPVTKEEGIKIGVHVEKNHCNPTKYPYVRGDYFIKFGEGTQIFTEVIELAIEAGIIYKGGSWLSEIDPETGNARILPDGSTAKWQGMNRMKDYLSSNDDYYNYLYNKISNVDIKLETIDGQELESIKQSELLEIEVTSQVEELLEAANEETKNKKKKNK